MENGRTAPWHPYPRPIFSFLLIDSSGIPILNYPYDEDKLKLEKEQGKKSLSDSILVSGLLTAINSFAKEIIGDNINKMFFETYIITISKAPDNGLFVLLCDTEYVDNSDIASKIHIEVKTLLFSSFPQLTSFYNRGALLKKEINFILEPYYRALVKKFLKQGEND